MFVALIYRFIFEFQYPLYAPFQVSVVTFPLILR